MALIIQLLLMKTCLCKLHDLPLPQGFLDKPGPRAGAWVSRAMGLCVVDPRGQGRWF